MNVSPGRTQWLTDDEVKIFYADCEAIDHSSHRRTSIESLEIGNSGWETSIGKFYRQVLMSQKRIKGKLIPKTIF